MKRSLVISFTFWIVLFTGHSTTQAAMFTPLEWQQPVTAHADTNFIGQLKHTTWIRDTDRTFIDDEIETGFHSGEFIDVIVDFNAAYRPGQIDTLISGFGTLGYICRLVSSAVLYAVPFDSLRTIAVMPEVAIVEWLVPGIVALDVSSRAIQARKSTTYSPNTVEDHNPNLTGTGVNVAILDSGVDDRTGIEDCGEGGDEPCGHETLPVLKFVAGFNATVFEDANYNNEDDSCEGGPCDGPDDEPADGTKNPIDDKGHGTSVASVAIGEGGTGSQPCRGDEESTEPSCIGIAPGAKLIDVKVCKSNGTCDSSDVLEGLDWIGEHREEFDIQVANLSLMFCEDDDGTSAIPQTVNALVALGMIVVIAHGNSGDCTGVYSGDRFTPPPGSASHAITVAASEDHESITRENDDIYNNSLTGPRSDFDESPDLAALKPDLTAPGKSVHAARYNTTSQYLEQTGSSVASPHVAGAAAIIRQAVEGINPGSVKDLLKRNADRSMNETTDCPDYDYLDPNWDCTYGSGMLNLGSAILEATETDIGFSSCIGPPGSEGGPCSLPDGLPSWNNSLDISTESPPEADVPNTITAQVTNFGDVDARALVSFGVYIFAVGNTQFYAVGTQEVDIEAGNTVSVSQPWTPADESHQCAQVSIDYGADTNFDNNVTQRNLQVAASVYEVRVENPFLVAADFRISTKSHRAGWECECRDTLFVIDPIRDGPRLVQVDFHAPRWAQAGDNAQCDVAVFATPERGNERLIGGVTVRTVVPTPCRVVSQVFDSTRTPLSGASLVLTSVSKGAARQRAQVIRTQTDADGFFDIELLPGVEYLVSGEKTRVGRGELIVRPSCGAGTLNLLLSSSGLELSARRGK